MSVTLDLGSIIAIVLAVPAAIVLWWLAWQIIRSHDK